ncbi:MAG TPA: septal ring lytic transglycosylase RlpA family protein [Gaiellaceae bacterium]
MTPRLAQREIALAGVALLAALVALVLVNDRSKSAASLPKPAGAWHSALAGVRPAGNFGSRTACGVVLRPGTLGVSHPVLPCGAKVYISFDGRNVLTQVIDRGPLVPGREFDLTVPLADTIGLAGIQRVRWAYASAP